MPPRISSLPGVVVEAPSPQTLSRVSSRIEGSLDVTPDQLHEPAYAGWWDATEYLDSLQLAPPPPTHRLVRPDLRDSAEQNLVTMATGQTQLQRMRATRALYRLGVLDETQYLRLASGFDSRQASTQMLASHAGSARASTQDMNQTLRAATGSHQGSQANLPTTQSQRTRMPSLQRIADDSTATRTAHSRGAPSVAASLGVENPRHPDPSVAQSCWRRVRDMPFVPQSMASLGWLSLSLYETFAGFETFLTGYERLGVAQVDKAYVMAQIAQPAALGFVAGALYLRANRRAREARRALAPAPAAEAASASPAGEPAAQV